MAEGTAQIAAVYEHHAAKARPVYPRAAVDGIDISRHGGGACSGKDPPKVDSSAAYAARWVAKNIVAAGLAKRCEIELAYAIGVAHPVSIMVDTFGTGTVCADDCLAEAARFVFGLTPAEIISQLDLLTPRYTQTAAYGHFGKPEFPLESTDKAQLLLAAVIYM